MSIEHLIWGHRTANFGRLNFEDLRAGIIAGFVDKQLRDLDRLGNRGHVCQIANRGKVYEGVAPGMFIRGLAGENLAERVRGARVIGEWNKRGSPNGRLLRKKIIRAYTYWVWGGTGPSYALHSPIL